MTFKSKFTSTSTRMDNLELQLFQRPDRSRFVRVRLRSLNKPRVISQVDVADSGSESRTQGMVLAAGGALAEHLGQAYGDQFDSRDVALQAREAYKEMMAEQRIG